MNILCPACDFENEEDTEFCSNCNEPLVTPKIPDSTENPYIKIKKEGTTNIFNKSKKMLDLLKKPFNKMQFFSKDWFFALWQGERPLWEAWWVLGLAIYLGYFLFLILPGIFPQLPLLYYYYYVLRLFYIFLQIFFWIVVWRCAPNVHNNFWFYLARFLILVAVLGFLGEFLQGF